MHDPNSKTPGTGLDGKLKYRVMYADNGMGLWGFTLTSLQAYGGRVMQGNDAIDNPAIEAKAKTTRKAKAKPSHDAKGKRSINLSLPVEDYERFVLHAMKMTNGNISELVCRLGREHLRDYHVTRTPTREA
jgi:hypothetical protein